MNIKSLLIGSAALATASTGALAADAIVVADPEPLEYVRICDVYGAGFFYIPGTETCLKIGGYFRYQINANFAANGGFTKLARFAPNFDVRSDTEIGTLRGYAEVEFTWQRAARVANIGGVPVGVNAYGTDVNLLHAYIQNTRGSHSWLFGRTESPWTRYFGYALFGTTSYAGNWSYNNTAEISYTFTGSNGFSFIAAVLDDQDANWTPDAEIGFKFERGWGHVGLLARGDFDGGNHGVKGSLLLRFGNSGVQWKTQAGWEVAGGWTAITGLRAQFTPKFAGYLQGGVVQGVTRVGLGADFTPTTGFLIRPEVTLTGNVFGASLRLQRSF